MNAQDTSIDLKAYFARIGFGGPARPSPTLDTLRTLHLLHPQAIPFENLDALLGRPVKLDLASIQRKLVAERRGGYCYEHNLLLRSVLQTLGFRVRSFAGRVLWGRDASSMPARTHMLLLVDLDEGTFLADVGFGGMVLSAPLAFETGLEQITPHGTFRLENAGGEPRSFILQALVNGGWAPVYHFDLDPQYDADYEMANHFVSTWPQSVFVHNLLAARLAPGVRYGLFNRRLHVHHVHDEGAGSEQRDLASVADLRRVLENEIGIRLPDTGESATVSTADLDAALSRLP
ncbi:arylamine N-acetyltransferase family protein [Caballeronia ptereochthonis]|uniref:N-hydroxyarylamine O-acetyltransferase n=1 Tax=Caballeronia ptereochthonis TaxID=1777144 RepID=A0A158D2B1_9BURK|nr:arylamine N-acetyltransferase [Caballeronia ptereochthonis]SAK88752.1 N-hydroxyarylamine O-acetyltransferase [Caballeronia ptereochthonis]